MSYLDELFGHLTEADHAETARVMAHLTAMQAAPVAPVNAMPCPKCSGSGNIPQFQHRKGGECFTCGGSGVFARYTA